MVLGLEVVRLSNTFGTALVTDENQPLCSGVKPALDIEKEIYGINETLEKIHESNRIVQERLE